MKTRPKGRVASRNPLVGPAASCFVPEKRRRQIVTVVLREESDRGNDVCVRLDTLF